MYVRTIYIYIYIYVCVCVCVCVYSVVTVRRISEKEKDVDWTSQSPVQEFYYDGDGLSGPVTTEFHEQHNYQCRTVDIISGLRQESPGQLHFVQ